MRDEPKNGCEGDQGQPGLLHSNPSHVVCQLHGETIFAVTDAEVLGIDLEVLYVGNLLPGRVPSELLAFVRNASIVLMYILFLSEILSVSAPAGDPTKFCVSLPPLTTKHCSFFRNVTFYSLTGRNGQT